MDKEAYGTSSFEHGTVAGVLWQKGTLGFAARPLANSGPARVGKETHFHLRSIAPSKARDEGHATCKIEATIYLITFACYGYHTHGLGGPQRVMA
jgi:hypothetical protein